MKKITLFALALSIVAVGCERNSVKPRSFAVRTQSVAEKLKSEGANVLAVCTEKNSNLNDIELAVYSKNDATGEGVKYGVAGVVKAYSASTDGGLLSEYDVNEILTADEVSNTPVELSVIRKFQEGETSNLIVQINGDSQMVHIVTAGGSDEINSEDVSCSRVSVPQPVVEQPVEVPSENPAPPAEEQPVSPSEEQPTP